MFEDKVPTKTPISSLGEFVLIDRLTSRFSVSKKNTVLGIGDDAAVIDFSSGHTVVSTDLLIEGIHFDLTYMPLKHLGYKAVMVNLSDVYAMNATATQITVSIAVSNRFTLEGLEALYAGIALACKNYSVDLVGGDTTSSTTGLIISITAMGTVSEKSIVCRSGALVNDLLVVSGDLGGAYMGLQILEREKSVFQANPRSQPDLDTYAYSIERQLKPEARKDIIELLKELKITPTSMIDISDGLSSEIFHIGKASKVGCRIFEEKIPIDPEVTRIAEEFKISPITAALNGGEDYELLMTIKQKDYDKIKDHPLLSIIGHIAERDSGYNLVTGIGQQIELSAQGWKSFG